MSQNTCHLTEHSIYAFTVLCFIGFVGLFPWQSEPYGRSAQTQQPARAVTASVAQAQNFAAERLCRGVLSATRCASFAAATL